MEDLNGVKEDKENSHSVQTKLAKIEDMRINQSTPSQNNRSVSPSHDSRLNNAEDLIQEIPQNPEDQVQRLSYLTESPVNKGLNSPGFEVAATKEQPAFNLKDN